MDATLPHTGARQRRERAPSCAGRARRRAFALLRRHRPVRCHRWVAAGAIGLLSREALSRWRGRLMEAGKGGKVLLGGVLVAIGLLAATGLDKRLATFLVDASPAWLTRLTTHY